MVPLCNLFKKKLNLLHLVCTYFFFLGTGDEIKENRLENQPFKFLHFNAAINIDCDTIDVKEEIEINGKK